MTEPSGPSAPTTTGWAYCSWHRAYSATAVLVRIIEQGSGPGVSMYACAPCRKVYRLTPIADAA
jgi:hypothetical protein